MLLQARERAGLGKGALQTVCLSGEPKALIGGVSHEPKLEILSATKSLP